MPAQAAGEPLHHRHVRVEEAEARHARPGERRGDGRADAARADHQGAGALEPAALAQHAAHEALAVEHVADEPALGVEADGVARAGHLGGLRHLVEEADGGDLVRHGDEGAVDVGEAEEEGEEGGVVLGGDAHGDHDGVDAVLGEIGVVDHRRAEGFGRVAEVGDEPGLAGDHGRSFGERGDAAEGELVALRAAADDDAVRPERDVGVVAEALALVDVGDVHLDHRPLEGVEGVEDGDRGVGEGAGIDGDSNGLLAGLVDPVDDLALPVRLQEAEGEAELGGQRGAVALDVGEGLVAVDLRLALAEEVEVRSVEDIDELGHVAPPAAASQGISLHHRGGRRQRQMPSRRRA